MGGDYRVEAGQCLTWSDTLLIEGKDLQVFPAIVHLSPSAHQERSCLLGIMGEIDGV